MLCCFALLDSLACDGAVNEILSVRNLLIEFLDLDALVPGEMRAIELLEVEISFVEVGLGVSDDDNIL